MARAGGFFQRTGLDPKMDPTTRFVDLPRSKKPGQKFHVVLDSNRLLCGGRTRARTWDPLIKSQPQVENNQ